VSPPLINSISNGVGTFIVDINDWELDGYEPVSIGNNKAMVALSLNDIVELLAVYKLTLMSIKGMKYPFIRAVKYPIE